MSFVNQFDGIRHSLEESGDLTSASIWSGFSAGGTKAAAHALR